MRREAVPSIGQTEEPQPALIKLSKITRPSLLMDVATATDADIDRRKLDYSYRPSPVMQKLGKIHTNADVSSANNGRDCATSHAATGVT